VSKLKGKVLSVELHCLKDQVNDAAQANQRALDLKAELYDERHKIISEAIAELRRLVYMGVGMAILINLGVLVWKR
jgi:hypothetical protein